MTPLRQYLKGPFSAGRTSITATGNQNFGWIGGGGPYPAPVSKVERDYSSDTTTCHLKVH